MRKKQRAISILLLMLFGFLSFKNLVPSVAAKASLNCEEFGHIHWYELSSALASNGLLPDSAPAPKKDEACHSSKSIFNSSPLPVVGFQFPMPDFSFEVDWFPNFKNQFFTADLEPHRRPPKV